MTIKKTYHVITCRNAEIDMWRFFASLIIMWHHLYTTGMDSSCYRFHDGDLFVELFFLITGYYTAKHFKAHPLDDFSLEEKTKTVIKYTLNKFKDLFGLCACVTFIQYMIFLASASDYSKADKIKNIANIPADIFLITNLYQRPLVTSFWYLSTLLIILPFVSLVMASSKKTFHALVSAVSIGIYYGFVLPHIFDPMQISKCSGEDLLRAFVCIYAGCFLCEASEYLAPRIKDMNVKVLLFVIGESLLVFLSAAAFIGHSTHIHAVLFFIIALICIFTNNLHCNIRLPYYLGKISLYIYIWNWTVGTFIRQYFNGLSVFQIKLLYFLMTITFAIISERTLVFITKILSNKSNPYYLELRTSNKDIA